MGSSASAGNDVSQSSSSVVGDVSTETGAVEVAVAEDGSNRGLRE
jgi:hypothetical protein